MNFMEYKNIFIESNESTCFIIRYSIRKINNKNQPMRTNLN